jgi:Na+/serine symporter
LVALSDSAVEIAVDFVFDVAVGASGDRDAPGELARIFQTLTLVVADGDAPIGQLARRNYALVCHWYLSLGSAAFGAIAGKRYEEARSTSLDFLK